MSRSNAHPVYGAEDVLPCGCPARAAVVRRGAAEVLRVVDVRAHVAQVASLDAQGIFIVREGEITHHLVDGVRLVCPQHGEVMA